MLRAPQYTKEQRVFMVNKKTMGESTKAINYDFKKCFPFSGRDPGKCIILKNKKKFDKEGIIFFIMFTCIEPVFISLKHKSNEFIKCRNCVEPKQRPQWP